MATKHVGVTKVEFHWYGVRLFLSKNDVNKILKYGPTSVSIATIWMPTTWVVKLAASAAESLPFKPPDSSTEILVIFSNSYQRKLKLKQTVQLQTLKYNQCSISRNC